MFICKKCLEEKTENWEIPSIVTRRECAWCGKMEVCVDIHHSKIVMKKDIVLAGVGAPKKFYIVCYIMSTGGDPVIKYVTKEEIIEMTKKWGDEFAVFDGNVIKGFDSPLNPSTLK